MYGKHNSRGLYFGPKTIFIPPSFQKWNFSPTVDTLFFGNLRRLLSYFFSILHLFYPFTSPLIFFYPLSSFFFPLSSFYFYILSLFLPLFILFPLKWHWLIFPPNRGGIFQYIDRCKTAKRLAEGISQRIQYLEVIKGKATPPRRTVKRRQKIRF